MTNRELQDQVLKKIQSNKIWVNALSCIRPTDEFKIKLADTILGMLDKKINLLPCYSDGTEIEVGEMQKLTPVLYLSINKS